MQKSNILKEEIPRKVVAASISGSIFAILMGITDPNPFGDSNLSTFQYIRAFFLATPVYLMYSFPVILIYGVLTSAISDAVARLIARRTKLGFDTYFSLVFHVIFGLILLWYSLVASILFFITDYVLRRRDKYNWVSAVKSLVIPVLTIIGFMFVVYLMDIGR
ncbi:hypothetical protein CEY16_12910 [Halalkalibacillus sediminis]|uniref:Yip1 domain-containing protein n=1 Tax=Halalkalibacillus sediminis TaxID=2018042 RepID=A0A2I0QQW3_9BACI|nr:hypothetical protein [Halalkalibacillus sediminis]PKR76713.1 hypothetical protein CEY16_12910 [Halalkalibacillus sediminis]